jgi:hypothetical protein
MELIGDDFASVIGIDISLYLIKKRFENSNDDEADYSVKEKIS